MEFSPSAKDDVKQAADIVEVISRFVQLKKAGQNYHGLCPFHSEKDPSFTVSPSKQMFHCFGCKKGGDVFDFWMNYHNVSFPQALRDLAGLYHVSLPEPTRSPAEEKRLELRESLFNLNRLAADFYHRVLTASADGDAGRTYMQSRGIDQETAAVFSLGYAPDRWDGLSRYLQNRNSDMEQAVQAGLVIPRKQRGWYDRFRGRLIFPIFTATRRIAGFGARVLDHSLPKYLNTPETPIFRKGEILYGLHAAGPAVRQSRRAVVVEGYTDVISLHRHGCTEAVATLGTALTRDHIRTLKGYAGDVVVVFDSDEAGRTAALKSLPFFLAEGVASRVLILPDGEDPDSFVRRHGLEKFKQALEQAAPMFDYFIDVNLSSAGEGIEAKVKAARDILSALAALKDRAVSALYVKRLADRTGIPEPIVLQELSRAGAAGPPDPVHRGEASDRDSAPKPTVDELTLLHLVAHYPSAATGLIETDWETIVSNPSVKRIFQAARRLILGRVELAHERLEEGLNGSALTLFRAICVSPPFCRPEAVEETVREFLKRIDHERSKGILEAARQGDLEEANRLLQRKGRREGRESAT